MKKPKQITIGNLTDLTYLQVLEIAYRISGLTYEEIAEAVGKGRETIHRYFTDPAYNPPTGLVPRLCAVLGNHLMIEWQCARVGRHGGRCMVEKQVSVTPVIHVERFAGAAPQKARGTVSRRAAAWQGIRPMSLCLTPRAISAISHTQFSAHKLLN